MKKPRKEPAPYWKKSHKCWYIKIDGKHHRLDPDADTARTLARQLLAQSDAAVTERLASPTVSVHDLLEEFLAWTEINRSPATLAWYQMFISGAKGFAGYTASGLRVRDLKPFHLTRWLQARFPEADNDTKAGAITALKRAFNWAKQEGYITDNPFADVKKPPRTGRGEEAYLTPDQWNRLLAVCPEGPFKEYITVMKQTGCRPQEIRRIEARHLDRENRRWVIPKEEAKGKKEQRIVELGDVAYAICLKLALKHPEGPLFRNTKGLPWTNSSLSCCCRRLEKKLDFEVFPYAIRHTFATEAILNGVDVITIARLMGHKDLAMLNRIYQHITRDTNHMQKAREKATKSREDDAA